MNPNQKAALLMMLGMACFTANDVVVKLLSATLPIAQLIVLRGTLVIAAFALAIRTGGAPAFTRQALDRWNVLRALCELAATFCFLSGLALLPLATATTLVFASPVLLTVLAALLLGEQVAALRWLAVAAGFGGVLLIAQPGAEGVGPEMALPLAAALFIALRDIAVRRIPARLSSMQVSLVTACVVTAGGLLASLFLDLRAPSAMEAAGIALCAMFICGAYYFYVLATRIGELSFVSPFKYVSIVLALIFGFVLWGDVPGPGMLAGAAVIVASGMLILYDDRRTRIPGAA